MPATISPVEHEAESQKGRYASITGMVKTGRDVFLVSVALLLLTWCPPLWAVCDCGGTGCQVEECGCGGEGNATPCWCRGPGGVCGGSGCDSVCPSHRGCGTTQPCGCGAEQGSCPCVKCTRAGDPCGSPATRECDCIQQQYEEHCTPCLKCVVGSNPCEGGLGCECGGGKCPAIGCRQKCSREGASNPCPQPCTCSCGVGSGYCTGACSLEPGCERFCGGGAACASYCRRIQGGHQGCTNPSCDVYGPRPQCEPDWTNCDCRGQLTCPCTQHYDRGVCGGGTRPCGATVCGGPTCSGNCGCGNTFPPRQCLYTGCTIDLCYYPWCTYNNGQGCTWLCSGCTERDLCNGSPADCGCVRQEFYLCSCLAHCPKLNSQFQDCVKGCDTGCALSLCAGWQCFGTHCGCHPCRNGSHCGGSNCAQPAGYCGLCWCDPACPETQQRKCSGPVCSCCSYCRSRCGPAPGDCQKDPFTGACTCNRGEVLCCGCQMP